MLDIRTLKLDFTNYHNKQSRFKFDFAPEGDVYWIFPESGYKISFHKSGKTHIQNNHDKRFYEEIDFSEESILKSQKKSIQTNKEIQRIFEPKDIAAEGRDIFAWSIPTFKNKENELIQKFVNIKGRHATFSLNSKDMLETMVDSSPVLYQTTDTKLSKLTENNSNCIVFDLEGRFYVAGQNRMFDMTDLANISVNTMMDMLGPWGRILQILGENVEEDDSNDDYLEEEDDSFFENLKLKKF